MTGRKLAGGSLALIVIVASSVASIQAQQTGGGSNPASAVAFVVGTLLDAVTQQPLSAASIQLLSAETREVRAQTVSNAAGEFRIVAPASGKYRLRTWRVDADTIEFGPFDATSEKPVSLNLLAPVRPIALAGIEVSVEAREKLLTDQGFYERRRGGAGVYLTPEAIANVHAHETADVLRTVPGLRFLGQTGTTTSVLMTVAGLVYEQTRPPRGRQVPGMSDPRTCLPVIFLDGAMVQAGGAADTGDTAFDLGSIPAAQLLAIEVFRGAAEVPARFQAPMAICGVVVIWTIAGS